MYHSVKRFCDTHLKVLAVLPAFSRSYGTFTSLLDTLDEVIRAQAGTIHGITKLKEQRKKAMVSRALMVAHAAYAYASDEEDRDLKERMNYSETDLFELRDQLCGQVCQEILSKVRPIGTSMGDYGVNDEVLDDLQTRIKLFIESVQEPRMAIAERKEATASIARLIKETDEVLNEKMDKLMTVFREGNPKLYRMYASARMIVDAGEGVSAEVIVEEKGEEGVSEV
ncbi:MAG: hypothetical protein ACOCXT_01205 [Candidatus Dojkabacteria bacterium]